MNIVRSFKNYLALVGPPLLPFVVFWVIYTILYFGGRLFQHFAEPHFHAIR